MVLVSSSQDPLWSSPGWLLVVQICLNVSFSERFSWPHSLKQAPCHTLPHHAALILQSIYCWLIFCSLTGTYLLIECKLLGSWNWFVLLTAVCPDPKREPRKELFTHIFKWINKLCNFTAWKGSTYKHVFLPSSIVPEISTIRIISMNKTLLKCTHISKITY